MCEPISMATMATIATVASAGVGAVGAIQAGNAEAKSARYEAQVAELNSKTAIRNAGLAARAGEIEQDRMMQRTRQLMGAQRVASAASGFDADFGTDGLLQADSLRIGRQDTMSLRQNTQNQVEDLFADATSFGIQGAAAKGRGASAKTAGLINAGSSILGGASALGGQWSANKKQGGQWTKSGWKF